VTGEDLPVDRAERPFDGARGDRLGDLQVTVAIERCASFFAQLQHEVVHGRAA